jgi:hypothetical protein
MDKVQTKSNNPDNYTAGVYTLQNLPWGVDIEMWTQTVTVCPEGLQGTSRSQSTRP